MTSLYLPPYIPTKEPEWDRFYGCNGYWIQTPDKMCGGISFASHIGKPLSKELWYDLMFRLQVQKLRVLRKCDADTTEMPFQLTAKVYLDENEHVRDVLVYL